MLTSLPSLPPFACTACIDIQFQYHYPYFGSALLIALVWFGMDAWRTADDSTKLRRVLTFWGIVFATGWFTLCMIPLAWGGLMGIVTSIFTLIAVVRPQTPLFRRQLAGLCLVTLSLLAGFSAWTFSRIEHQIAWLGHLPTHGVENRQPVQYIRSAGRRGGTLLIQAAERELAEDRLPHWNRYAAFAREIGRLNRPDSAAVMSRFRDLATQACLEGEYNPLGTTTVILACGPASTGKIENEFSRQIEACLEKQNAYGALVFLTAWGLADREAAMAWRTQHEMQAMESAVSGWRHNDEAIHALWKELQNGPVTPEAIQHQLDQLTPAVSED